VKYRAATPEDKLWFCRYVSYSPSADFGGIVAFDERGLHGMIGLDHWTPTAVCVHFAICNPHCTRGLWKTLIGYLSQHGRTTLIGMTPSHHSRALRVCKGLGWVEVGRIKDGWMSGSDIVITEYRINVDEHATAAATAADAA
jgi:hypothetical protein